jgi:hypothetical protein
MITPELFSDRGVAWVKAFFDVAKVVIDDFGILALAILAVWQNVRTKADSLIEVKARLDRQGEKIETNSQAITAVALSTPVPEVIPQPEELKS